MKQLLQKIFLDEFLIILIDLIRWSFSVFFLHFNLFHFHFEIIQPLLLFLKGQHFDFYKIHELSMKETTLSVQDRFRIKETFDRRRDLALLS